ncbi:MAG: peptide deformylase [Gammaproteobacteria bacterium]
MAILHILHYPDPLLRKKALPVQEVDDEIRVLVDDMFETMYDAPGIGLAAPQVNVSKRLIVLDITEDKSNPICLVNPVITAKEDSEQMEEGCLSVPGIYDIVERAARIQLTALDRDGQSVEMSAEGILAVCIQHEIDHLDGKLFVDYLSDLKRKRIRKKMDKVRRHTM